MKDITFFSDYVSGACPEIMSALMEENRNSGMPYGQDETTSRAANRIKKFFGTKANIFFVSGGTQANTIAMASMLGRLESIITTDKSHVAIHEAGAIEAIGNKVHTARTMNGKLTPKDIQVALNQANGVHMVSPKVVVISQPTERGVIYSDYEIQEIGEICRHNELYLYIDGSRLGNALASKDASLSHKTLEKYCDILCLGGTKNGALYGEALVVFSEALVRKFDGHVKQRGALLSKSRFIAAQFEAFFDDNNVYMGNAKKSNEMALKLMYGIRDLGLIETQMVQTNQVFVKMPNSVLESMFEAYELQKWQDISTIDAEVRLMTGWNTCESDVEKFLGVLKENMIKK